MKIDFDSVSRDGHNRQKLHFMGPVGISGIQIGSIDGKAMLIQNTRDINN